MKLEQFIEKIKQHPDYHQAGMILAHNGVVRQTSRDGRKVTGLRVAVDRNKLESILARRKETPGIIDILVEIFDEQDLVVGDDVMFLVVAGEFPAETLRRTPERFRSRREAGVTPPPPTPPSARAASPVAGSMRCAYR